MKETTEIQNEEHQQFDVVWLLKYIYSKRLFIIKSVIVCMLLCVIICILRPKKYKAEASILPISNNQMSSAMSRLGGLSSLASMAGVDIGSMQGDNNIITRDLYPRVASSTPFLLQMCDVEMEWEDRDREMGLYEYIKTDTIKSFFDYLYAYTIGLPGTISNRESENEDSPIVSDDATQNISDMNFISLNKFQKSAVNRMSKMISVEEDPTINNLIVVTAIADSPDHATILASQALDKMQEAITSYKTKQAKLTLDFIQERYDDALTEYKKLREALFLYEDSHRNMIDERVSIEYQQLSDEYQISYSILKSLSSQIEQSKINLMENTPAFSVVDPVVKPMNNEKYSPKMKLHIVAGFALGIVFSIGWLLLQLGYWQVFNPEKVRRLQEQY